ncbi:hypothetical protein GVN16_21150 [Emticicia sp. CRIBPO]|uniref:hypothetical protein n=1 Tax=Emticicia sp. CRIBPO TaxID=2683258 RepID=UPI001411C81B|nr:hypothetical protein [Emticicia sp. CRIBPO]NBA88293.1 hypothetical protein [Emticicia sp. CRIBPO]
MLSKIQLLFETANNKFLSKESEAILSGVSERNLCGSLMLYIREELNNSPYKEYYTDIEYNRKQDGKIKTIVQGEYEIIQICCDLIIHSRGENIKQDNLIAIEMKRSTHSQAEKRKDKIRLKCLTRDTFDGIWSYDGKTFPEHVCRYVLGVYYEINVEHRKIEFQYMTKGKMFKQFSISF